MYISLLERKLFPNDSPYQHSRRRYVALICFLCTIVLVVGEYVIFSKSVKSPGKARMGQAVPWAR
jgi:hypothetical protein